ncbi:BrnT family toxin [Pusillimonas sp. ANT_WB101]|uniref:BrnT family toxin n=1 Tax=Pusillimonas sp. ANT_WB101 TaxID=2597356 RepID=UPI0011EFB31B|nr:BrnT family toxin [Pusillimonas sp. ANT_WB101]KAA0911711.1 BrnT family toxin [Pusillimonas sp. ANT_WB101]
MDIAFDYAKDAVNQVKHGVSLALASKFEWDEAVTWQDVRQPYGELRMVAIGYIGQRLYVVVYVDRDWTRRIISLRKANSREINFYAKA